VLVINKSDLPPAWPPESMPLETVRLSALTGEGVDALSTAIAAAMHVRTPERDVPAVTNLRHAALLVEARGSLAAAAAAAAAGVPEEFVLADLHEARERLEQVTGARTTDDMLARIFSSFCIGK
jgi:tRNA modification GTPase